MRGCTKTQIDFLFLVEMVTKYNKQQPILVNNIIKPLNDLNFDLFLFGLNKNPKYYIITNSVSNCRLSIQNMRNRSALLYGDYNTSFTDISHSQTHKTRKNNIIYVHTLQPSTFATPRYIHRRPQIVYIYS